MNEEMTKPSDVSYFVYEGAQARAERTNRRLIIALLIAITFLFVSNIVWLILWARQDFVKVDGGDGVANYIGNDGDIYNGETKTPTTDVGE